MIRSFRSLVWIVFLSLVVSLPLPPTHAKKPELTDVQAKLAIIYNFISRYAKWPGEYAIEQANRVNICAVGRDALTKEIELLTRASTARMTVSVFHDLPLAKLGACHVVYVAESERRNISAIIQSIRPHPVLSFSSLDNFVDEGGMIALIQETQVQGAFERNYIRYDVNATNVSTAQLYIDPDALELARRVIR